MIFRVSAGFVGLLWSVFGLWSVLEFFVRMILCTRQRVLNTVQNLCTRHTPPIECDLGYRFRTRTLTLTVILNYDPDPDPNMRTIDDLSGTPSAKQGFGLGN